MKLADALPVVLHEFHLDVASSVILPLGNAGGMSGARIWRIVSGDQTLALRAWPPSYPSADRLEWIHRCMVHAASRCQFVPRVHVTRQRQTFVQHVGRRWELTDWMPGQADFSADPSDGRLENIAAGLALLHQTLADLDRQRSIPPGLVHRREMLQQLTPRTLRDWQSQLDGRHGGEIQRHCELVLSLAPDRLDLGRDCLERLGNCETELIPCLRDVWHDHVLFTGNTVTGIVDYGAMAIESPVCDLARLLGSLVPDQPDRWETALEAYERQRRLAVRDRELLAAIDGVNPCLSGLNWVRWLYVDRREFDDLGIVLGRLQAICRRLQIP